ncbi:hypothetical protein JR316_0010227 [Psilocybe cubensis]|uniref:Uncharacterized protein n=1 Tax=Psilocybe cubensis TaxID=181762 RepID=A0ACB8GSJ2_PSICU|nr:hypothetical protein JR316_0010227 [Psilocybe cubensis]KAH9477994.1 hypothetical protein JR316_0010227 [Psilocybe cubensis]
MGRQRKQKNFQVDEYESPDEKLAKEALKGDVHTDYLGKKQQTVRLSLPVGVDPKPFPPLMSNDSPTPTLDWVLQNETPFRVFDGDIEIQEMEDWIAGAELCYHWTGTYFRKISSKSLGLRIQLGHADGICEVPIPAFNDSFVIISVNGIHEVALDYCGCTMAQSRPTQLLRSRLFPSTVSDPKTAATFEVLEYFQLLSFNTKSSGFEFYQTLSRLTDNTGTKPPPNGDMLGCLSAWGAAMQNRALKGQKRENVLFCAPRALIRVSIFRKTGKSAQNLSNANFRLKRMNVSNDDRDPPLNHGYAYMVESRKFREYLDTYDSKIPDEKSNCNNHDAIKSASIRGGKGTAASGLGTIECSRHDMKRPVSVGDLQKGERHCCQTSFSFNFTPGVGRTDGESPERGWSSANGIASSTKEMGPGSRNDTLDDHFGDYNWRKIIGMANTFVRKAKEAITAREEHVEAFIEFDAALPVEVTTEWTRLCQAWEKDSSQINPYVIPKGKGKGATVTERDVRLKLAAEDAASLARGDAIQVHDDISPSLLIYQGLQFEELQHRITHDSSKLGLHATSLQQSRILERSNSLRRRIDAWISIQHLYMPVVASIRSRDDAGATEPVAVQDIKLFLPSFNTVTLQCSHLLLKCEWEYRNAQAEETLTSLRALLLLRSHMYKSKHQHSRGQRMQTRSQKLLSDVQDKINYLVKTYRRIHTALENLSPSLIETSWRTVYRPLLDEDVAGLTSLDDSGSEGRKQLSWIWKVQGTGADADACTQAEWCKSRARAHRWQEECILLAEEMRRVIGYFEWKKNQWKNCVAAVQAQYSADSESVIPMQQELCNGKVAYAHRQQAICGDIMLRCQNEWQGLSHLLTHMEGRNAWVMVECH